MTKVCSKCKVNPALSYHAYCYSCLRISKGQSPVPKFKRDGSNKTLCSKCKKEPRLPYHNYCLRCKNDSVNKWFREKKKWSQMTPEEKQKAVARRYVKTRVDRGHMKKLPCAVCGNPQVQSHHHKGYDKEHVLDVVWLCVKHHRQAEKELLLTKQ